MKKLLALILVLALVLGMAACAADTTPTDAPTPANSENNDKTENTGNVNINADAFDEYTRPRIVTDRPLRVAHMVEVLDTGAADRSAHQMKIEAAHRGWDLYINNYGNASAFPDAFRKMIADDYDVIILHSVNSIASNKELIAEARNAGIGVYCNDTQVVSGCIGAAAMPNGVASMEMFYRVASDYQYDLNNAIIYQAGTLLNCERTYPIKALSDGVVYPNINNIVWEDLSPFNATYQQTVYEWTQTWLTQYGDEIDWIMTGWDACGESCAEAIIQAGDPHGEKTFVTGMDGDALAYNYIRNNTPYKYTYSQPFELYTHNICELVEQVQVKGLNPGDEGCSISYVGQTIYATGIVTGPSNCPDVGANIHSVFDYYGGNPNDPDAWYNWDDGVGIYTLGEATTE